MNIFKDIYHLFLPPTCAMCGEPLQEGVDFFCTGCRWEMPLTGFCNRIDNPVVRKFYGHLPIVNASAFLWFSEGSVTRNMIHNFKYRGNWRYALKAGEWYGRELRDGGLYADVDIVVPVPLHFRKLLKRGYNQSEYIAEGIASALQVPVDLRSTFRKRYNRSQTEHHKEERWKNVENIFAVRHPESLKGKHILIVDDVLTTGATIISFARTILEAVPECRISIAALAVSRAELGNFK